MFCVKDLFELENFSDWKVVGGKSGLSRSITSVTLMESPDVADWAIDHQFILTTGYCIRDDKNVQEQLIIDLAEKNCSGLAVKMLHFFRKIPEHMIRLANEKQFPLIEVPASNNVSMAVNEIMREVFVEKFRELECSYRAYRRLAEILLRSGNLNEIAEALGSDIEASIILSDANWVMMTAYSHPCMEVELAKLLECEIPATSQPDHSAWPIGAIAANVMTVEGNRYMRAVYPIEVDEEIYGYLTIWGKCIEVSDMENIPVLQAIKIIALECKRNARIYQEAQYQRNKFFSDYLGGKIISSQAFRDQSVVYGINYDKNYLCILFRAAMDAADAGYAAAAQYVTNTVTVLAQRKNSQMIVAALGDCTVVLMPVRRQSHLNRELRQEIEQFLDAVRAFLAETGHRLGIAVGVGTVAKSQYGYKSYEQACEAFKIGKKYLGKSDYTVFFCDLEIECFLSRMNHRDLQDIYNETIGVLKQYDPDDKMDLVNTLEANFRCHFNSSKAAKEVFVHRNTFLYRINRVMELLDMDVSNHNDMLKLEIALRIGKLL